MKCPSCKKENSEGVKFCKYCGSPILGSFKTCGNGHNYEANLSKCPFCPSIEYEKTVMDAPGNEKTVMDNFVNSDRTVIDTSTPSLKRTNSNSMPQDSDKTIIFNPRTTGSSESSPKDISLSPHRKLVGWLVSYDIDPYGKDFRLFEGRSYIIKSNRVQR